MLELHKLPLKQKMGEHPPGKNFQLPDGNSMPKSLFLHSYEINHIYEMYKTVQQRKYFYTEML
jgi:hypothetical protein